MDCTPSAAQHSHKKPGSQLAIVTQSLNVKHCVLVSASKLPPRAWLHAERLSKHYLFIGGIYCYCNLKYPKTNLLFVCNLTLLPCVTSKTILMWSIRRRRKRRLHALAIQLSSYGTVTLAQPSGGATPVVLLVRIVAEQCSGVLRLECLGQALLFMPHIVPSSC